VLTEFSEHLAREVAPFGVEVSVCVAAGLYREWAGDNRARTYTLDAYDLDPDCGFPNDVLDESSLLAPLPLGVPHPYTGLEERQSDGATSHPNSWPTLTKDNPQAQIHDIRCRRTRREE
jgi:hypothetical protein